jgi:hypothetical protein
MDISEQVLSVHWRNASESTTRWVKARRIQHVRNCKSENPAAAEKVDVRTKNNRDVVVVWR